MKSSKHGFTVTLSGTILALLVVAGGIYFYTHWNRSATTIANETTTISAVSMASWKTYQNIHFGIHLKYPSDWSLTFLSSASSSNSDIVLDKNGYKLTVNMCSVQDCGGAVEQTYIRNASLSPYLRVPLNIGGFKAWRTAEPIPNGEDDTTLYFNFTFLRKAASVWNNPGFNDTSQFTPVSNVINDNGMVYTIDYQLPSVATASGYDHSIIDQMDDIIQGITLSH